MRALGYYAGWIVLWLVVSVALGQYVGQQLDVEAAGHPVHAGQRGTR